MIVKHHRRLALLAGIVFLCQQPITAFAESKTATRLESKTNCKAESGWHLEQKSAPLGDLVVDITPTFFRLQNDRAGTVTIASPPEWQVTTYNARRKIFYRVKRSDFRGRFAMWAGSLNRSNLTGLKFIDTGTVPFKDTTARRLISLPDKSATVKQNEEQVWAPTIDIIENPRVPLPAAHILCQLYIMPPLAGIPVTCVAKVESQSSRSARKLKKLLDTTVYKAGPLTLDKNPDLSGYKSYPDEVTFSNANNGSGVDLQEFTDYMGK